MQQTRDNYLEEVSNETNICKYLFLYYMHSRNWIHQNCVLAAVQ